MIHPLAWIGWLIAVMAALSTTRNPMYLALILLCIALVDMVVQRLPNGATPVFSRKRFVLLIVLVSAAINALSVHYGDTVLFTLPEWLPLLGGPVTLEALVFGALNGLALAGIFLAFATAQRALPTSALVGLIPRAFYSLAVVAAIAITFVPTTLRQARQIRDAQAIRGHRMRRLRDWLPLLLPLLIGGLERALQLAESMAARGFAGMHQREYASVAAEQTTTRLLMIVGLSMLLTGWLLLLAWGIQWLGVPLMLAGAALLLGRLWWLGRRVRRTHYRQLHWTASDTAVLIGAVVTLAAYLLPVLGSSRAALFYYPYPALQLPPFDPILGFATLGLAWPAVALWAKPAPAPQHTTDTRAS